MDASFENPDVLCVDESPDVLTYLRAVLKEAGYRTLTAANMPDALILLRPLARGSSSLARSCARRGEPARHRNSTGIASAGAVVELPPGFSGQDAGDAAHQVLQAVRNGGKS